MNDLSEKAKLILKEAVSRLPHGVMRAQNPMSGAVQLIANKKNLIEGESNGRAIAVWNSALEELVTQGLLKLKEQVKYDPLTQTFEVTEKGYKYAESLGLLS